MSDLKSSVMHSLKWVMISKIIIQAFRWISTFWVIRLLVPEDYAVVAISDMIAGYLVALGTLGLGAPLISMRIVTEKLKRQMLTIGLLMNSALAAIQYSIAPYIADYYNNPAVESVLQITALAYIIQIFTFIPSTILARKMKFKFLSIVETIAGTTASIVTILCALNGFGFWSLVIGYLSNEVIKSAFFIFSKEMLFIPSRPTKRNLAIFVYCLKMSLSEILFHAKDSIDIILAGLFLSPKVLGLYNVGLQISSMPLRKIVPPLRKVAFPALCKVNEQFEKLREYFMKLQRLSFFLTIPIFWGIASVADLIVPLVLGDTWKNAAMIIMMLCLAMPFRFAEEMLHPVLKSLQKGNEIVLCNLGGFLIFGISVWFGIQNGLDGLMYSWLIGLPLIYLFSAIITCRNIGASLIECLWQAVVPMIAGGLMFGVVEIIKFSMLETSLSILMLPVAIMMGGLVYLASIYIMKRSLLKEIKDLRK